MSGSSSPPKVCVITPLFGSADEAVRLAATSDALADAAAHTALHHLVVDATGGSTHQHGVQQHHGAGVLTTTVVADDRDWLSAAFAASPSECCVVLFAGDRCTPDVLAQLTGVLDEDPALALVYTDHRIADHPAAVPDDVTTDEAIGRVATLAATVALKPAPSPEYLRRVNYIANAAMVRPKLVAPGRFDPSPVVAVHDLMLRGMEAGAAQIAGIGFDLTSEVAHLLASAEATAAHLERCGLAAEVAASDGPAEGVVDVRYRVEGEPLVSVVIPTRGSIGREWGKTRAYLVEAIESLRTNSSYRRLEFVVVYDHDTPPAVLQAARRAAGPDGVFVEYDKPFNFSDKINVGAAAATGEMLLLLNDDTELIAPGTVAELVGLAQQPDVGVVGARLLFADGTLQHGGHVYSGEMLHACESWPGDGPGPLPLKLLACARETSGVTAAAAMVRREVFDVVGGFSPAFPVNFNDVDFCLKLVAAGYRNLWTPNALWYHFESVTRGRHYEQSEVDLIFERWEQQLHHDPYYSELLIRKRADWLEMPGLDGNPFTTAV